MAADHFRYCFEAVRFQLESIEDQRKIKRKTVAALIAAEQKQNGDKPVDESKYEVQLMLDESTEAAVPGLEHELKDF